MSGGGRINDISANLKEGAQGAARTRVLSAGSPREAMRSSTPLSTSALQNLDAAQLDKSKIEMKTRRNTSA